MRASCTATCSAYAFCVQGDIGFDVNQASLFKDKDILDRARIAFTAASTGKGKTMRLHNIAFRRTLYLLAGSHAPAKATHTHASAKGAGKGAKGAKGARKGFNNFSQRAWFTNCTLPTMSIDRIGKIYLNRSKGHGKKGSSWGQRSHGYRKW